MWSQWALLLSSNFALLLFLFPSQVVISCYHFAFLIWSFTSHLALKPIASKHAYFCAHPVIAFSPFLHRTSHSSFPFDTLTAFVKAAFSLSVTWKTWFTEHETYTSLTAYLMLLCCHYALQRTDCPLSPIVAVFHTDLRADRFACFGFRKFLFHRLQTGAALCLSSSTCTKPPN